MEKFCFIWLHKAESFEIMIFTFPLKRAPIFSLMGFIWSEIIHFKTVRATVNCCLLKLWSFRHVIWNM